jgi:hypothetical protein
MTRHRFLSVAAVVVAALGLGVVGGFVLDSAPAKAAATHAYTLRLGDEVTIPAIRQTCLVASEGGAANLVCATKHYRHQVTIFRDNILVWKAGSPEHPVWHGKP